MGKLNINYFNTQERSKINSFPNHEKRDLNKEIVGIKKKKKANKRKRLIKSKLFAKKNSETGKPKLPNPTFDSKSVELFAKKDSETGKPNLSDVTTTLDSTSVEAVQKKKKSSDLSKKKSKTEINLDPELNKFLHNQLKVLSQNWEQLKKTQGIEDKKSVSSNKQTKLSNGSNGNDADQLVSAKKSNLSKKRKSQRNDIVALDCEMVGIGKDGEIDLLARVSIVDFEGNIVYDQYVKPTQKVTDYRTHVSGIKPFNLLSGITFQEIQKEVSDILQDKILVGHDLRKDMKCLDMEHPISMIRDTAKYTPFRKLLGGGTPSLKKLASVILDSIIQTGEHNSIEDARAAMKIYRVHQEEWEAKSKETKTKRNKYKVKKITPENKE